MWWLVGGPGYMVFGFGADFELRLGLGLVNTKLNLKVHT